MIGYIKGTVEGILSDGILLENGGIGYQIHTSGMVLASLSVHQDCKMYTYLHVREDELSLFGFPTMDELNTFKLLLSVNGIGPKAALSILSVLSVQDLAYAVMMGDTKTITKANGIGAKGANRIVMELKDKLSVEDFVKASDEAYTDSVLRAEVSRDSIQDTVLALVSLGYSDSDALRAIKQVPGAEDMEAEVLLKAALKKLF